MKALWIAIACACVIVPLATSDPSGPQSGTLEVLDANAAALDAAAGVSTAAKAVGLPPPARMPAAARPASSFLFMMSPLRVISLVLIVRKSAGLVDLRRGDAGRGPCGPQAPRPAGS